MTTRQSTEPAAVPTVTVDSGALSERTSIISIVRSTGRGRAFQERGVSFRRT